MNSPPRFSRLSRAPCAAFTLIELLVVTMILAGVAAAIGASIMAGMRVMESARTFNAVEARAQLGLAMFERDLRNSIRFYAIPFSGTTDELSYPAVVLSDDDKQGGMRIGTVRYRLDVVRGALVRSRWAFPAAESSRGVDNGERMLAGVRSLNISYRTLEEGTGLERWADSWHNATNRPDAVRIELRLEGKRGPIEMGRTVAIPSLEVPDA